MARSFSFFIKVVIDRAASARRHIAPVCRATEYAIRRRYLLPGAKKAGFSFDSQYRYALRPQVAYLSLTLTSMRCSRPVGGCRVVIIVISVPDRQLRFARHTRPMQDLAGFACRVRPETDISTAQTLSQTYREAGICYDIRNKIKRIRKRHNFSRGIYCLTGVARPQQSSGAAQTQCRRSTL